MSEDTAQALLEQLCQGDAAAAERAFQAYEPYLRTVVRRMLSPRLRAKFDSIDVVQSVWADVFQGLREGRWQFANAAHLRAFLVKATRNRFLNRVRHHKHELSSAQATPVEAAPEVPSRQPRPSEAVQADDVWEQLLALCPAAHRMFLEFKRQGLPLKEIAARTGLHEGSVRRILYDLARRFAFRQAAAPPADAPG